MTRAGRVAAAVVAVAAMVVCSSLPAGADGTAKVTQKRKSAAELAAAVIRGLHDYRATLVEAVPTQEAAIAAAREALEERQSLHRAGTLSREYVEAAESGLKAAERDLDDTRTALAEVDDITREALVQSELAKLPRLRLGGYEETASLVRYNGSASWSLAEAPKLASAFERFFGRRLPVTAFGQTALHSRLGFDHREAIDVALHPDSAEGQWLMQHLRSAGIPFIAARMAIAGASTGAHIHVGRPSDRAGAR